MNGKYQVGSGRIVTVTHDTPFIEDIISQDSESVKSEDVLYSDRDPDSISNRALLANALESATIYEDERRLANVRKKSEGKLVYNIRLKENKK